MARPPGAPARSTSLRAASGSPAATGATMARCWRATSRSRFSWSPTAAMSSHKRPRCPSRSPGDLSTPGSSFPLSLREPIWRRVTTTFGSRPSGRGRPGRPTCSATRSRLMIRLRPLDRPLRPHRLRRRRPARRQIRPQLLQSSRRQSRRLSRLSSPRTLPPPGPRSPSARRRPQVPPSWPVHAGMVPTGAPPSRPALMAPAAVPVEIPPPTADPREPRAPADREPARRLRMSRLSPAPIGNGFRTVAGAMPARPLTRRSPCLQRSPQMRQPPPRTGLSVLTGTRFLR